MVMTCQEQFSIYQLDDSSLENEYFFTTTCISNRIKFGLYVTQVCLSLLGYMWVLSLFYNDYRIKGWKFNFRKKVYLAAFVGLTNNLLNYVLFLAGVTGPMKYFFYPLVSISNPIMIDVMLKTWYKTIAGIIGLNQDDRHSRMFNMFTTGICVFIILNIIVVGQIVSMIEFHYGSYYIFNIVRTVHITANNVYGIIITTTLAIVSRRLSLLCRGNEAEKASMDIVTSDVIISLSDKLMKTCYVFVICLVQSVILSLFPLWMIISSTIDNPLGLNYITYFMFVYVTICSMLPSFIYTWLVSSKSVMFADSNSGSSHNNHSNNSKRVSASPMSSHNQTHGQSPVQTAIPASNSTLEGNLNSTSTAAFNSELSSPLSSSPHGQEQFWDRVTAFMTNVASIRKGGAIDPGIDMNIR